MLTAFFYLLLLYISPDANEQKEVFRKVCTKWILSVYTSANPGSLEWYLSTERQREA